VVVCNCRALKRKTRHNTLSDSVTFDNLNYSRLPDTHDTPAVSIYVLIIREKADTDQNFSVVS